jgi:hypothetical protein
LSITLPGCPGVLFLDLIATAAEGRRYRAIMIRIQRYGRNDPAAPMAGVIVDHATTFNR